MADWVALTVRDIANLAIINEVSEDKVLSIARSIAAGTFTAPDLLYDSTLGAGVTGSHRIVAAQILVAIDNDILPSRGLPSRGLGDIELEAIDVHDEIEAYCEEHNCTFDDLPFDDLREFLSGTDVEDDARTNAEW